MTDKERYKSWEQADPRYNETQAWPAALFPDARFHLFKECGCLITSLAILLRHYGIEKEEDENLFNPWILNQRLIACGAFDSEADLEIEDINKLYPLEYSETLPYSREKLVEVWETGRPFLIAVPGVRGERHFIVPDDLTEDDMAVIDCAWGKKYLSEFDQILEIRVFKRNDVTTI